MIATLVVISGAFGATVSQATRLSINNSGPITATGVLTLNSVVTCDVSLTLTANRTIAKTTLAAVGSVTAGTIRNCNRVFGFTGGTVLGPIPVNFGRILGTLPAITGIAITGLRARFNLISTTIGTCEYTGNQAALFTVATGGLITRADFTPSGLPQSNVNPLCPTRGDIAGALRVQGTPPNVFLI